MKKQNRLISLLTITFFLCNQIAAEAAFCSPQNFHLRTRSAGDGGARGPTVTKLQKELATTGTTSLDGGKRTRVPEQLREVAIVLGMIAALAIALPFLSEKGILPHKETPGVKIASPPGSVIAHPPTFYHDAVQSYYSLNSWGAITTVLPDMRGIVQKPLKGTPQEQVVELIKRIGKHKWNDEDRKWMRASIEVVRSQIEENGGELPVYVYRQAGVEAEKRTVRVPAGAWSALQNADRDKNALTGAFGNAVGLVLLAQGDSARDGANRLLELGRKIDALELQLEAARTVRKGLLENLTKSRGVRDILYYRRKVRESYTEIRGLEAALTTARVVRGNPAGVMLSEEYRSLLAMGSSIELEGALLENETTRKEFEIVLSLLKTEGRTNPIQVIAEENAPQREDLETLTDLYGFVKVMTPAEAQRELSELPAGTPVIRIGYEGTQEMGALNISIRRPDLTKGEIVSAFSFMAAAIGKDPALQALIAQIQEMLRTIEATSLVIAPTEAYRVAVTEIYSKL